MRFSIIVPCKDYIYVTINAINKEYNILIVNLSTKRPTVKPVMLSNCFPIKNNAPAYYFYKKKKNFNNDVIKNIYV